MKKYISILLAVMMLGAVACAAFAEDVSLKEEKFNSDWAIPGGLVRIDKEDDGYRMSVEIAQEGGSTLWQYSGLYNEEKDALVSVSSSRTNYKTNPENGEKDAGETVYEGLDDENKFVEFTVDGDGFLIWKDGYEDAGAGLKFQNIGRFDGVWRNEAEETEAEFLWNGTTEDELFYTVYITRGKTDAENFTRFLMNGSYDPQTGKLTADGTCTLYTKNAEGEYDASDDGENYDAIFSMTKDGKLLYETANGIELEYDIMGHPQSQG